MDISVFKTMVFWRKFSTIFMFGLSLLFLTVVLARVGVAGSLQRGVKIASAQAVGDCVNGQTLMPDGSWLDTGCSNSGGSGQTSGQSSGQTSGPTCGDFTFRYNECFACNQSRKVSQDSCGTYKTEVNPGTDSACASWCPQQSTPPSQQTPSCPDDVTYCDPNAGPAQLIHKHGGRWDGSQCVYAFDRTGQSCGGSTTTTTTTQSSSPVCNGASISVSSGSVNSGEQITFTMHGDASTWVGDSNSGLSNCSGALTTDGTTMTCTANSSGSVTHTWKHCDGDVNNCSSTCSASASFSVNSAPFQCPAGQFITTNSNGQQVCMPIQNPPTPPGTGGTVNNAPCNGGPFSMQGSTVICGNQNNPVNNNTNNFNPVNNFNPTVTLAAAAPKPAPVVTTQYTAPVKELPKTGLPLAGWLLGGLLPVGAKMRKFGSSFKDMFSANDIWEERQFKSTFK